jgi:hypothetical protein
MKIGAALRGTPLGLLGISLDQPASGIADRGQRGTDRRPRNPAAPVPAASEEATDPPVGQLPQALGIGLRVVDVRQLGRPPVLAPAARVRLASTRMAPDWFAFVSLALLFACVLAEPGGDIPSPGRGRAGPAAAGDGICREIVPATRRRGAFTTLRQAGSSRSELRMVITGHYGFRIHSRRRERGGR